MRPPGDPLGELLLRTGALTEEALADALDQQRHTLPLASLCYVLGYADEETLVRALSRQYGVPGVILDRCILRTDLLDGVSSDLVLRHGVLPVYEDERRIFVAAQDPSVVGQVLRELQFVRGKNVVPHVALHITLARTSRALYVARAEGQRFLYGPHAAPEQASEDGYMDVVSDAGAPPARIQAPPIGESAVEPATGELMGWELVPVDEVTSVTDIDDELLADANTSLFEKEVSQTVQTFRPSTLGEDLVALPVSTRHVIDLDEGYEGDLHSAAGARDGPGKLLIVDDDFATRHLLVKAMQPLGFVTLTSSSGGEAVRKIKASPPDIVIIDAILPDMDGSEICRAIKQSRMYQHISVVLMSAMLDAARVTDDVLRRYGADAYFAKPLDTERIKRRISELLHVRRHAPPAAPDDGFQRALALYEEGDLERAIEVLRAGLEIDPLSAKHHFVLANLLQRKALWYEAIEEYEATIDLKPDYFPALTRLAFLYYKKGFSAKAIEIWRRSLPHCADEHLRRNIEAFMRKLIADMQRGGGG